MRVWQAFVLALALAVPIALKSADVVAQDRRIALVVGNGRYGEAPLRNPVNDARAMAATLRERGFEVLLRENATKQQMESAVADFGEKLTEGSTGLFFYAGHGMQVNGRNYLVPVDAKITAEARVRLEALDVDAVLDQMQAARSKVNVVILDACRNNPFERRFRSAGGGLAQINAPEGTLIAYATAPGKVAADGEGSNGLYTQELLRALRTPGLKVEDVFKQVRINVSRASQGAQTPWEASSLIGDFYFLAPEPPKPMPPAPSPQELVEQQLWEAAKSSTDTAELQVYLRQFPSGRYAAEARQRIVALTPKPAPPPPSPQELIEERLWEAAKSSSDGAELQVYVRQFPSGRFAAEARQRMAALAPKATPQSAPPADFLERSLWDMVRASNDAAEIQLFLRQFPNSPFAAHARQRLAALPPAAASTSSLAAKMGPAGSAPVPALAGRYAARLRNIHALSQVQIDAWFEVADGQIKGSGYLSPDGRTCPIAGTVDGDGVAFTVVSCSGSSFSSDSLKNSLTVTVMGRFIRTSSGDVEAETTFTSNDGRVGAVTWRRTDLAPSVVSATPATTSPAPAIAPSSIPETPRVASAVVAQPRPASPGALFDGRYRAVISGATWLVEELPAEIEINGNRLTGNVMRRDAPRPCPISGTITEDGTIQPGIRIDCDPISDSGYLQFRYPRITIFLDGRFSRAGDGSEIVGETTFRTQDRLKGSITWRRM